MSSVKELGRLGRLAAPMILAQVSQMGMGAADTIMAGRVSPEDLAGVALGGNLFWPSLLFITGTLMSITPSVSQLHGQGRVEQAGEVVRQALWMALLGAAALLLLLLNAAPILGLLQVDPRAIPISAAYLQGLSWGVPAFLLFFALRYLCDGLSWTLPAMLVALSALALKVPLNWLFIHGGLGMPAMGGVGCGYASAIVMTYEMVALAAIVANSRMRMAGLFARFSWPDWREIKRLARLGAPIGGANFLEVSLFSAITLAIGRLGVDAVAAHQSATNIAGLVFMVPMALGMAASVRVGFNVGRNDLAAARRSGLVAFAVCACFSLAATAAIYFGRATLAGFYSNQIAVLTIAAELLVFAAAFQLADGLQVAAIGSLRGYKDTGAPMALAALSYWGLGFPIALLFGFGAFGAPDFGVHGFWLGTTAGLTAAAVALIARFQWLSRNHGRIAALSHR